jgi:hypothetical protein
MDEVLVERHHPRPAAARARPQELLVAAAAVAKAGLEGELERLLLADHVLRDGVEGLEVVLDLPREAVDEVVEGDVADLEVVLVHPAPLLGAEARSRVEEKRIVRVRLLRHGTTLGSR